MYILHTYYERKSLKTRDLTSIKCGEYVLQLSLMCYVIRFLYQQQMLFSIINVTSNMFKYVPKLIDQR